jgi:hypothetical protein
MTKEQAIEIAIKVTEAAFWDNHTAGTMPGSGYHHKPYTLVSASLGWRDTKKFEEWKKAITSKSDE